MWDLSQPDERTPVVSITTGDTASPIWWLESQPGYWRGRAAARRPDITVDIWSAEALRDHQMSAQYELNAEQCETLAKERRP